ncbi:BZ3501_MvSof-1269-A2-R1_Chr8-1g09588 [Microbotryum saponariae]|nr:BZ3501_MvSof-1269-A2-R1_Chr8-1g09588 [Microbotryum saponariae]
MDSDDSDVSAVRLHRRQPPKEPQTNARLFNASSDASGASASDDDVRSVIASKRARNEREASAASSTSRRTITTRDGGKMTKRALPRFLGDEDEGGGQSLVLDDLFGDLERVPAFNKATDRDRANALEVLAPVEEDPWAENLNAIDPVGGLASTLDVEGVSGKKQRQPLAKLNDVRLLGPSGFPKLLDKVQKFKIKGVKGEEKNDLKRVLRMYQLWCHQMYPRTNLTDTLKVVEKLCHKRSVQSALKQYREEHKLATQPPPPAEALLDTEDQDGQAFDLTHGLSSPGSAGPLTRLNADEVLKEMNDGEGMDGAMEDDWDEEAFEAMLANEEEVLESLGKEASTMETQGGAGMEVRKDVGLALAAQEEENIPDDLDENDWMDDEAEAAMRELEG